MVPSTWEPSTCASRVSIAWLVVPQHRCPVSRCAALFDPAAALHCCCVLDPEPCCADIFNSIFSTGPAVALIITLILDNTVPGTREERGLHVWMPLDAAESDWWEDEHMNAVRAPVPNVASCRGLSQHAWLSSPLLLQQACCLPLAICSGRQGMRKTVWTENDVQGALHRLG